MRSCCQRSGRRASATPNGPEPTTCRENSLTERFRDKGIGMTITPCSYLSHATSSMYLFRSRLRMRSFHSAIGRPYLASIDGKLDAGPLHGICCQVTLRAATGSLEEMVEPAYTISQFGCFWRILAINVVSAFFGKPNRAWSTCDENTAFNQPQVARTTRPDAGSVSIVTRSSRTSWVTMSPGWI